MIPNMNLPQNCIVDTKKPVFQIIGKAGDAVFGSVTYPLMFRINATAQGKASYTTAIFPVSRPGYISAHERAERISRNPKRAAALAKARQRFGDWAHAEQLENLSGLALLRMQAGLSQTELAQRLNKPQSNVSRLERGEADPKMSTIKDIALALGVDVGKVAEAFARSKTESGAEAL